MQRRPPGKHRAIPIQKGITKHFVHKLCVIFVREMFYKKAQSLNIYYVNERLLFLLWNCNNGIKQVV